MARKVYAYQSIASLAEHPCYDEIKSSLNIAATAYMTNALRARYAFPFIMCMRVVQKRLSAGWEEDSLLFQQYLNISAVIRKMCMILVVLFYIISTRFTTSFLFFPFHTKKLPENHKFK